MIGQVAKVGRFAGPALVKAAKFLKGPATKTDLAIRLGLDLPNAIIAGASTPGDIFDKVAAGGTEFTLGSVAGLAAGRLAGKNQLLGTALDAAGSYAGFYAGVPVSDAIMRGKDKVIGGKGQTPYERLNEEQQEILREQITQNVLQAYGLLPGSRPQYFIDPTTGQGVA